MASRYQGLRTRNKNSRPSLRQLHKIHKIANQNIYPAPVKATGPPNTANSMSGTTAGTPKPDSSLYKIYRSSKRSPTDAQLYLHYQTPPINFSLMYSAIVLHARDASLNHRLCFNYLDFLLLECALDLSKNRYDYAGLKDYCAPQGTKT